MQQFDVGTRVWFVDSVRPSVKLLLVSEEIIKKTMNGNSREYIFQIVVNDISRDILGSKLSGSFFAKREEAFEFMHNQAGEAINKMMDKASESITEASDNSVTQDLNNSLTDDNDGDTIIVELPNGQIAKMKKGALK